MRSVLRNVVGSVLGVALAAGMAAAMVLAPGAAAPVTTGSFVNVTGPAGPLDSVICAGEIAEDRLPAIMEDMRIMARILEKSLGEAALLRFSPSKLGLRYDTESIFSELSGGAPVQTVYLQGYGALFIVRVGFPVVPPRVAEEKPAKPEPPSLWEETKQELSGPAMTPFPGSFGPDLIYSGSYTLAERGFGEMGQAQYDAGRVAKLRQTILETLRQAANIRDLKPQDWIIVAVVGGRQKPTIYLGAAAIPTRSLEDGRSLPEMKKDMEALRRELESAREARAKAPADDKTAKEVALRIMSLEMRIPKLGEDTAKAANKRQFAVRAPASSVGALQSTVLTIQVKKADVDALSQGKLTPDEFEKRAGLLAY